MQSKTQTDNTDMNSWQAFSKAYLNRHALSLLFLGFSAGVPILLIFASLGIWLREAGIDRSTVTMFGWAGLGYSFKFIWSPLVNLLPVPLLSRSLGQRRAWLLVTQVLMILALVLMAMTDPAGQNLGLMAAAAVLLGFSAASQDIVIDAYRIESAPASMQTALSATYITGYRIGMVVSGAGALYLADFFGSTSEHYSYLAWQKTYLIMAAVMLISVATTLSIKEPQNVQRQAPKSPSDYLRLFLVFLISIAAFIVSFRFLGGVLPTSENKFFGFMLACVQFLGALAGFVMTGFALVKSGMVSQALAYSAWAEPVVDFFRRYGKKALFVLALIGLYRVSDVVAGNISSIFYQDLGFSKTQIANAVKVVGVVASIGGGLVGGWLAQKTSIMRAMSVGAILACMTNLLFIVLIKLPTSFVMYLAVITDNLAAGLASTVFVAFLSALTSIRFTAVQYALFSSLMTLSPKLLGGYSGSIVDATSYEFFFGFTFVIGLPVLLLIYLTDKYIKIEQPNIGDK